MTASTKLREPTFEVWEQVLLSIGPNHTRHQVGALAVYFYRRYLEGRDPQPDGSPVQRISQLRVPVQYHEDQPLEFSSWWPMASLVAYKYPLAAPLLKLVGRECWINYDKPYRVTVPNPEAIDFELTPAGGPQVREFVEAMLHLNMAAE